MRAAATALPAPHGPSAADLITWWHDRADFGGTTTERSCTAVATTFLGHVAQHADADPQAIDMRTPDVDQLVTDHADCLWPHVAAATRHNYTNRLRRAVADFLTALDDPTAVRPGRARARLDAARNRTSPTSEAAIEYPDRTDKEATMTAITELETAIGTTANGGSRITRIWHCGEHTVRARVAHDSYRQQSFALAEVLTPALEWTKVCETPPEDFHFETFGNHNKVPKHPTEADLLALAEDLMRRACQILHVPSA
ncbi:hypothetical protein [Catenulispora rubra]|uniref:hypothetical protein n=1 Tax=Catenulispora rubra TaxID=280293 RepID=UPI001892099B|nr:hypothetical protein [Catenulispora rubra]